MVCLPLQSLPLYFPYLFLIISAQKHGVSPRRPQLQTPPMSGGLDGPLFEGEREGEGSGSLQVGPLALSVFVRCQRGHTRSGCSR